MTRCGILQNKLMQYLEHWIPTPDGRIYAREYPDNGPAIILMHGFPDNLHLYDFLIPLLTPGFHPIVFDFLGWHLSDKPSRYRYTAEDQRKELEAVIRYFDPETLWLVAHDASGPPAINYTLDHPERVHTLVLLNTYFCRMESARRPEAIWIFSTRFIRIFTGLVARNIKFLNKRVFFRQVGGFFRNQERRKILLPELYRSFSEKGNFRAFLRLNADLDKALDRNTLRVGEFGKLSGKTLILFGEEDPYLNTGVAENFQRLILDSERTQIPRAGHYVQVDAPETVAGMLIRRLQSHPRVTRPA